MKKLDNVLHIIVDISLEDRIARGKYDRVNSDIMEKNFPIDIPADYSVEHKLFHFDRNISSQYAIKEMEKEGFRPAKIAELLTFGEQYPETQRQFSIVALGSVWRDLDGSRHVPVLYSYGSPRKLDLHWFENDWYANYRFLAVRK